MLARIVINGRGADMPMAEIAQLLTHATNADRAAVWTEASASRRRIAEREQAGIVERRLRRPGGAPQSP